jgi:hypothetical protein
MENCCEKMQFLLGNEFLADQLVRCYRVTFRRVVFLNGQFQVSANYEG